MTASSHLVKDEEQYVTQTQLSRTFRRALQSRLGRIERALVTADLHHPPPLVFAQRAFTLRKDREFRGRKRDQSHLEEILPAPSLKDFEQEERGMGSPLLILFPLQAFHVVLCHPRP